MQFRPTNTRRLLLVIAALFFTLLCSGYAVLLKGLHVDRLTLAGVTVEDATLKWQNGLNLEILGLEVDAREGKGKKNLNGTTIKKALTTFRILRKIIPSITVHSFRYKQYRVELLRREELPQQPLVLALNADDLHLDATLIREQDDIRIIVTDLSSTTFNSSARGSFLVDANTFQVRGEVQANLADCLPVQLSIAVDDQGISFQGQESGEITTIKPFVDLFGLKQNIQPWITDYLKASRYQLNSISGHIPWHDPAILLDTLTANVRVDDCAYTFAQGLEPIKADYAELTYSKEVLDIIPHGSSFYGQDGGESRLDINFNDPANILLTASIKTKASANDDIVKLLDYYKVELPFVQTAGTVDSDLTLAINLNRKEVQINGAFEFGESVFTHEGISYRVQGGRVELHNRDIAVDGLDMWKEDFFRVRIDGPISFEPLKMDLNVEIVRVTLPLKDIALELDSTEDPLRLSYSFREGAGTLVAQPSHWTLGSRTLRLDAFSMPLDFRQFAGTMPPTRLVAPSRSELYVSGEFNIEEQFANMQVALKHLQIPSLALAQESLDVDFHFDGQLHVTTDKASRWQIAGRGMTFSPLDLWYGKDRRLRIEKGQIQSAGFVDTRFRGSYDFSAGQGRFHLDELNFKKKGSTTFLEFPDDLVLDIGVDEDATWVALDQLGLFLLSEEEGGWEVAIRDLAKLLEHSRLLQRLKISGGTVHLETVSSSSPLQFSGKISSAYDFLVQGDQPQSDYDFSGTYGETGLDLVVNKDFSLHYSDAITIHSRNLGFNVPAILRFRKDRQEQNIADDREKDALELTLQAEESFVFFRKENRILADTMTLTVRGDKRVFDITHGQGKLVAKLLGDSISLKGQKLDDRFINALIADANVEGGYLRVVAKGTLDTFSAIMQTDETLLKEYAMLNNTSIVTAGRLIPPIAGLITIRE